MKITLDHNCLIHLERETKEGNLIRKILNNKSCSCFVVNIGASELLKQGIRPDRYDLFEKFLQKLQIEKLTRLNPMILFDVSFFDRSIFADDAMKSLADKIYSILFENFKQIEISDVGINSKEGYKWLNRVCDAHSLWSHIHYKNDIFLTTDKNFTKKVNIQDYWRLEQVKF